MRPWCLDGLRSIRPRVDTPQYWVVLPQHPIGLSISYIATNSSAEPIAVDLLLQFLTVWYFALMLCFSCCKACALVIGLLKVTYLLTYFFYAVRNDVARNYLTLRISSWCWQSALNLTLVKPFHGVCQQWVGLLTPVSVCLLLPTLSRLHCCVDGATGTRHWRMMSSQGWVFAMAKSIFARTVEKTGKNRK